MADTDDIDDTFKDLPVASFSVGGQKYGFPVQGIRQSGGNRLVQRERPYRDGAKLDDTGSRPRIWTMTGIFNNDVQYNEPGLAEVNGSTTRLYPDILNYLIDLFDIHETGDLVVPTIGKVRARAESYDRAEEVEPRSTAEVTFTFVEDNEDDVNFRTLATPTAQANAKRLAETTTFDAQSAGDWDQALADIDTFMNELEDLANSPGDVAGDIKAKHRQVVGAHKKAIRIGSNALVPGRSQLLGTEGNRTERKLQRESAMAARTTNEARRGRPRIITLVVHRDTSLFAVAATAQQDFEELVEINPTLDPLFIPAGSHVKVFANQGRIR